MAANSKEQVQELKDKGNEAMKVGNYTEAVLHYTYAAKLDPIQYQLFSNRSLAFLKLQQYYHALEDARETIRLKPDWAKGYFRKAEVEFQAQRYRDALQSYRLASCLDPINPTLIEGVRKTSREIEKVRRAETQVPWLGAGVGFVAGTLIVVGDHISTARPSLGHPVLKVLIVLVFAAIGYGVARLYRYYLQVERNSLLEPPIDLLGAEGGDESDGSKENGPQKTEDKRRTNKAAARQRYKTGKR